MNIYTKATVITAIIGSGLALAMPATAATQADCKAEFAKVDTNRDNRLNTSESKQYTQVMSQVDVNKDGNISADEYIVACKKDAFKNIKKQGS